MVGLVELQIIQTTCSVRFLILPLFLGTSLAGLPQDSYVRADLVFNPAVYVLSNSTIWSK